MDEAGAVLDARRDARLLTEYEAAGTESGQGSPAARNGEPTTAARAEAGHRRVEIVHESLLTHWPRLARWRTQDADGAQLRDQLRQAAHLWDERGRRDDLLWTGPSYLDYRAWRARYAGGLSALEGEFGQAMTALAERQRRRRRMAVAVVVAALAIGLGVFGVLWTRSEAAPRRADAEALRAEASKLLALGQAELDRDPTAGLVYTTKSLELADTEEARRFALRVLQRGPARLALPASGRETLFDAAFSADARRFVQGEFNRAQLLRQDGGPPIAVTAERPVRPIAADYDFAPDGNLLIGDRSGDVSL